MKRGHYFSGTVQRLNASDQKPLRKAQSRVPEKGPWAGTVAEGPGGQRSLQSHPPGRASRQGGVDDVVIVNAEHVHAAILKKRIGKKALVGFTQLSLMNTQQQHGLPRVSRGPEWTLPAGCWGERESHTALTLPASGGNGRGRNTDPRLINTSRIASVGPFIEGLDVLHKYVPTVTTPLSDTKEVPLNLKNFS